LLGEVIQQLDRDLQRIVQKHPDVPDGHQLQGKPYLELAKRSWL
jgi:hypothetical protein